MTALLARYISRFAAVLLCASLLAAVPYAEEAEAQAYTEWECDGTPILMRGGIFHYILPDPANPGELIIEAIPGTSGIWNSTAFDPLTNLVYGVGSIGGQRTVRAYDATGAVVFNTQIQDPYPDNASTYAGTVLGDGRYIIHSVGSGGGNGWYAGARFNLWSIDPISGAATHIGSTPVNFADFSYNPLDGYLYQAVNRVLYKVDPNTGAITTQATSTVLPNGSFGASWFDSAGILYLFQNKPGNIYKIDPNNPTDVVLVGEPGSNGGTDAASCVSSIDIKKDVVDGSGSVAPDDRLYGPGDTVTYEITLINNGLPTQNRTIDLCDVLPADGRTYTGVWSSTDPTATVTSGGSAGDTDVCFEADMPSSLWTDPASPGSDPTVVTFEVLLGDDIVPGDYENQATLDFDQDGTVDILSDDPGDSSDPRDPTTIEVRGGFEVAKVVEGHPVDNGTDEFVVTLQCTTADGATHDVAASAIVDTATGNPWPGASTNTFTMSHTDDVRVEGIPAGTTCTTTETLSSAYAASVTVAGSPEATSNVAEILIDSGIADEQIDYVNRTATLAIRKTTSAASALPVDNDGTFTFDIVCDNGVSETVTITTADGTASIGYPTTPLIADGADCTVSENVPDGWVITSANDIGVVADTAAEASLTFTNERDVADLTVTKNILGLPESDDPTSYSFDVTVSCTGGFDPDPYTTTASFAVGSPVVIEDVPVGAECTVTEDPAAGFTTRYSPGQTVEIDADGETVQVTNSTGTLVIEKTTQVPSAHPVDPVATFEFTLVCDDGFNESYEIETDSLLANGATGGISHAEVGVFATGTTCTATEQTAASPDWTLSGPGTQNLSITDADPEPTASFLNVRNVGSLTVTKTLEGVPAGIDLTTEPFTIDVSCEGDFTVSPYVMAGLTVTASTPLVIDDLPTGADCTVTEQSDPRFTAVASPTSVTIDSDGETVALTNSTSSFVINKATTSDPLVDDPNGTFAYAITCTNGGSEIASTTASITTVAGVGSSAVGAMPLVPPGSTCTVTETVPSGWTLTARTGGTNSGAAGIEFVTTTAGTDLEFENTLDTATLTITKDVTGVDVTAGLEAEEFTVNVECSGNFAGGTYSSGAITVVEGTPAELTGLPVGATCTVAETADGRFTTSYSPAASVTMDPAGNTVSIENETSTFELVKQTSVAAGVEPDATFEFTIECSFDDTVIYTDTVSITTVANAGTWLDAPFMPPGTTCSVTETSVAGWTPADETVEVTTSSATTEAAMFTNVRDVADLTITKTLVGIPDSLNFDDEEFTVNATCTGDFATSPLELVGLIVTSNSPVVVADLPTGAECTITEDFDSRFQTIYAPENPAGTASVVTIGADGAEAGIINSGGVIAIRKDTLGPADHPLGLLDDFDFDIACSNGYSETRTLPVDQLSGGQGIGVITYTELPVLPAGTTCTVTEVVPAGWTVNAVNPQTLTIGPDPQTAQFINERDTGVLTITKTINNAPIGLDLSNELFTVEVTCTGGGLTVDPYVISDQISEASPLVIADLPTGTECSTTETPDPRFATEIGDPVTVDDAGVSIEVTNTTSTFSITKATTGITTHPIDLDATFTFGIVCTSPGGVELYTGTEMVTTDAQAGSWVTPDTPLLPPGTECSITEETPPAGWTNTSGLVEDVTTSDSTIVEAAFTNERDTDDLFINKTVIGSPDDLSDEEFTVDVSCTGGFVTEPYLLTGLTVSENGALTIPDLPSGAACVVTERNDPRFLPSYAPDDQTAIVGADGSVLDIDNRTGTFQVAKQVETAGSQPIDLSGTFLIDVSCTDGTTFTLTLDVVDGATVTSAYPDVPLLPDGTGCTVTEQGPPTGWTLATDNDVEVIINSTLEPLISFTNSRDTADLTVSKTVIGTPDDLDASGLSFLVDVTCTGDFTASPLVFADQTIQDGETLTFPDLPTGAICTVIEDTDDRFATTMAPVDAATAGVEITATGADVAIVNATGEIMIVKNTQVTSGLPVDVTESFDFSIDCGAVYAGTHTVVADTITSATAATGFLRYDDLPALPNGTACTITELAAPAGWTLTTANDVVLTVDSTGVVVAEFTNVRDTGSLTITKTLAGVPAGTDLDAELFDVTITCTGGFTTPTHTINGQISADTPLTINNLPTATECAVTETADARFSTAIDPDATITDAGETINVTNTTSTLSISKITEGPTTHPIVLDTTFSFAVVCTSAGGVELFSGTQTITTDTQAGTWATPDTPLLPPGTSCEVTETVPDGWTVTTDNPQTVTTDSATIFAASFTNVRDTGSLTITKTLAGVPAGTDLDAELFDVTITCTGGFTTPTHTINGQISVDTPLTINNLPTGTICSVAETPDARFATAVEPFTAVDVDGAALNVTNTTSTFSVSKVTEGPVTHPIDLNATFTFDITCTSAGDVELFAGTQTITTVGQAGTWATPATPLLPPGTTCTISEQTPPAEWTNTSGETEEITTAAAAIADASFTNVRDTGTLTISKTVLGAPDDVDLSGELFDVTVTCVGGFTGSEHTITGQISATTPLEIPDLPTGATCEVVEDSDARFATSYFPEAPAGDAATTVIEDTGNAVIITNSTGAVIVAKQTIVSLLHPTDPVAEFTFTIDCGAVYTADHTLTTDTLTATGASGQIYYTDLPLIPEGTACEITELDETPEWTLATDRTVSLVATSADPVTASFVNVRNETQLTINKTVEGPDNVDLSTEPFEVSVSCTNGFTDETYIIVGEMSATSPLVIEELPFGAQCSAVETPDDRFAATDLTGEVLLGTEPAAIGILNQTGSFVLDIDAIVNSTRPVDPDDDFQFTVTATLPDGTVVTETVDVTTTDGAGTWESGLFPTGTVLTVTLEPADGWSLTDRTGDPQGERGIEITIGTDVGNVAFEVERDLVALTIDKELENVPAAADFTAEAFVVTISCVGDFTTDTYDVPGTFTVSSIEPLIIDDLPTGSTCEINEAAHELFDATYEPTNTITLTINGGNELTITNTGNEALQDIYAPAPAPLPLTGATTGTLVRLALMLLAGGAITLLGRNRFGRRDEELA